ncbi:hypothetical protein OAB63_00170 [Alphaproteobacteria bacterium]|nr:hypothetical protein [Alphaproteobacteria bacterium]
MKKIINLAFEKYIILLFLTLYAIFINYIYDLADYKLVADASSYLYFSFENLNVFFSQHRSFLFPLILNTYVYLTGMPFGESTNFFGYFNFFLFLFSVWFLYITLVKLDFSKFLCGFLVYGILLTYNFYIYFTYMNTDVIGLSFFFLSLGSFLNYVHTDKKLSLIMFSLLIFCCILIRSSYIVTVPCFLFYFYRFNKITLNKKVIFKYISFIFTSNILIVLFVIIRLIYTGHLGLVSFTGVLASNHLTFLAEIEDVEKVSIKNRDFIRGLIERRDVNMTGQCSISYDEAVRKKKKIHRHRASCYNNYLMAAWLENIKHNNNYEPFPSDDERNHEAWNHTNLSGFFNLKDNNDIDQQLMSSTREIILLNPTEYLNIVIQAALKGSLFNYVIGIKYLILLFIVGNILMYILFKKINISKKEIVFFELNLIHFFMLTILTCFMNFPEERFFICQLIILLPSLSFYILSKYKN